MPMLGSHVFTTEGKANCNLRLKTPTGKTTLQRRYLKNFYMIFLTCVVKSSIAIIIFSYKGKLDYVRNYLKIVVS